MNSLLLRRNAKYQDQKTSRLSPVFPSVPGFSPQENEKTGSSGGPPAESASPQNGQSAGEIRAPVSQLPGSYESDPGSTVILDRFVLHSSVT